MTTQSHTAPKDWKGRFFEDLEVGDVYRSRLGRTITETDNTWFTLLTCNTNQVHFNAAFAEESRFGKLLVNSCLTLSVVVGLSVADTSENAIANLSWDEISLPSPVFAGDTLWSESEVLGGRPSRSRPDVGIVDVRTRGVNQRREVVVEFARSFMVAKREEGDRAGGFPGTDVAWTVKGLGK